MANRQQKILLEVQAVLEKAQLIKERDEIANLLKDVTVNVDLNSKEFEDAVRKVFNNMSKEAMSAIGNGFNKAFELLGKKPIDMSKFIQMPNDKMWEELGNRAGQLIGKGLSKAIRQAVSNVGAPATGGTGPIIVDTKAASKEVEELRRLMKERHRIEAEEEEYNEKIRQKNAAISRVRKHTTEESPIDESFSERARAAVDSFKSINIELEEAIENEKVTEQLLKKWMKASNEVDKFYNSIYTHKDRAKTKELGRKHFDKTTYDFMFDEEYGKDAIQLSGADYIEEFFDSDEFADEADRLRREIKQIDSDISKLTANNPELISEKATLEAEQRLQRIRNEVDKLNSKVEKQKERSVTSIKTALDYKGHGSEMSRVGKVKTIDKDTGEETERDMFANETQKKYDKDIEVTRNLQNFFDAYDNTENTWLKRSESLIKFIKEYESVVNNPDADKGILKNFEEQYKELKHLGQAREEDLRQILTGVGYAEEVSSAPIVDKEDVVNAQLVVDATDKASEAAEQKRIADEASADAAERELKAKKELVKLTDDLDDKYRDKMDMGTSVESAARIDPKTGKSDRFTIQKVGGGNLVDNQTDYLAEQKQYIGAHTHPTRVAVPSSVMKDGKLMGDLPAFLDRIGWQPVQIIRAMEEVLLLDFSKLAKEDFEKLIDEWTKQSAQIQKDHDDQTPMEMVNKYGNLNEAYEAYQVKLKEAFLNLIKDYNVDAIYADKSMFPDQKSTIDKNLVTPKREPKNEIKKEVKEELKDISSLKEEDIISTDDVNRLKEYIDLYRKLIDAGDKITEKDKGVRDTLKDVITEKWYDNPDANLDDVDRVGDLIAESREYSSEQLAKVIAAQDISLLDVVEATKQEVAETQKKIETYEELTAVVKKYLDLRNQLKSADYSGKDLYVAAQDVIWDDKYRGEDGGDDIARKNIMNEFQKQWSETQKMRNSLNNGTNYDDGTGNLYVVDKDTLKNQILKLQALAAAYTDLGGAIKDFKSEIKQKFAFKSFAEYSEQNKAMEAQTKERFDYNDPIEAQMRTIEKSLEEQANDVLRVQQAIYSQGSSEYITNKLANELGIEIPQAAGTAKQEIDELTASIEKQHEVENADDLVADINAETEAQKQYTEAVKETVTWQEKLAAVGDNGVPGASIESAYQGMQDDGIVSDSSSIEDTFKTIINNILTRLKGADDGSNPLLQVLTDISNKAGEHIAQEKTLQEISAKVDSVKSGGRKQSADINPHYITDPSGKQVEVYRGIRDSYAGTISNRGHGGTFTTDDIELAKRFAGAKGKIEKSLISMKNPLEIDGNGADYHKILYIGNGADEASKKLIQLQSQLTKTQVELENIEDIRKKLLSGNNKDESEIKYYEDLYQDLHDENNRIQKQMQEIFDDSTNPYNFGDTNKFVGIAKQLGYDGVIFKNVKDGLDKTSNLFATFQEDQIHHIETLSSESNYKEKDNDNQNKNSYTLESTLQTVEGVLEAIKANASNVAANTTDNSVLTAIKTAVESINKKIVQGTKVIDTGKKKTEEKKDDKPEIKNPKELGDIKATKVDTKIKSLEADYAELGRLEAQLAQEGKEETAEEIHQLETVIARKKEELKLEDSALKTLNEKLDIRRSEASQAEEAILLARQADKDRAQAAKDEKADLRARMKRNKEENRVGASTSAWNAGNKALESLWKIDSKDSPLELKEVKDLMASLKELNEVRQRVNESLRKGITISEDDANELKNKTMAVNQQTEAVKDLISNYDKLSNDNPNVTETGYTVNGPDIETQLKNIATSFTDGKAKIGDFDAATNTLKYTIKTGSHEFKEYELAVRKAGGAIVSVEGVTKRTETFLDAFKRKFGEILRYFSASSLIYKAFNELRKGIQYIREIDSALTELKKVTNETEETYDKFLDTAAKTADKVGSTIKDIVSSTADWARLGYSMKEAAQLAESTQILMNVSEFTNISDATDSLISSIQAFKYTAEESMDVVNILNTIGNNYAISTADLAKSLTKSSGSLVAANGTLEEAVALTAAANTIIQDADSVGTALKTVAMRLRGTSVTELEEAGLDTDGAIESVSKLQSKIKSLSGVNILTDTGAYKSTYQILSEIAEVWEDMDDMKQAALLELLAGKRAGSVMSAILQNPDILADAFESANNAAGSALAENEKYLDSIQGRIDLFNNAVQTMWNNTLDSDTVKNIVDLGTKLVKLIDKIGLFKSSLIALSTYSMFKHKMGPIEFFKNLASSASQGISNLETRLKSLKNLGKATTDLSNITANFTQVQLKDKLAAQGIMDSEAQQIIAKTNLGKATDKLSASTLNATLREMGYSQEKREAIIQEVFDTKATKDNTIANVENATSNVVAGAAEDKETADTVENTAATIADTAATNDNTKANMANAASNVASSTAENMNTSSSGGGFTSLLGGAKNFVKQNKAMIAMAGAAAVIALGVKVVDWLTKTTEELEEEFGELTNKLDTINSELDSLESQLKDINNQIEEINSNSPLSFTDQEELNRLKAEGAELQRQIDLLEVLKKEQALAVNSSAIEMANNYKDIGMTTGNSTEDNVATGGKWGAIGGGVAGAAIGASVGSSIPIVGTIIGAIIGVIAGAIVGVVGGAAVSAAEEKIDDSLDNMKAQYSKLEKEFNEARKKYQDDPTKKNKKNFEKAQEAFNAYQSNMANYLTEMDSYYAQIKANWDVATTEQKEEYVEWQDTMDTWAIQGNSSSAKTNAITRIFGETASDELKEIKKNIEATVNAGKEFDWLSIFNGNEEALSAFKQRIYDMGLTLTDIKYYYLDVKEAENAAMDDIDTYSAVKEINSLTEGVQSLKNAFKELSEEGIISAATIISLQKIFGNTDGWSDFVNTVSSGTSSISEAKKAIENLAETYIDSIISGGAYNKDEYWTYISHLQSLGVTNAQDFIDAKLKKSMVTDLTDLVVNDDMSQQDAISEIEKEYGIKLDGTNDLLLIEKAITAEKAKQNVEDTKAAKNSYDAAVKTQETIDEINSEVQKVHNIQFDNINGYDNNTSDYENAAKKYVEYGVKGYFDYDIGQNIFSYNGKKYADEEALRSAIIADLERNKPDDVQIPVKVTDVDVINAEEAEDIANKEYKDILDKNNFTVDIELRTPTELVDDIQNIFDTLSDAQKEYEENGYLSVDTLQTLLNLEPKYLDLLVDEEGNLNLTKDALYNVAKARIIDMGIQSQRNILEKATALASEGSSNALREQIEVMQNANEVGADFVEVEMAKIRAMLAEKVAAGDLTQAEANAFIEGTMNQIEAVQQATQSTLDNLNNSLSTSNNTTIAETEDAFQKTTSYWENRIDANQAKYKQIQNEIDLLETKGMRAGEAYYREQIEFEKQRQSLLEQQKVEALAYLKALEEGSDEWWEVADTINGIEDELDDVTASIQEINDAIGQIRWDGFEELHDRFSNLKNDLENIRDILSNEDMFDDEGNFTKEGVATLAAHIYDIQLDKNALADVQEELADFQQGYEGNEDYFATIGIDSEQEYYDKLVELTDKQDDYVKQIKDSEQSVVEMYENQIDAIEEYINELVDGYNDYIDVVKESLDAERD